MKQLYIILILIFTNTCVHAQPLVRQWDFSYGGYDGDFINQIAATADGGFIVGGISQSDSSFDKTENSFNPGSFTYDLWIIKCDANGVKLWDRTLGGTDNDFFYHMTPTSDGGVLIVGSTKSPLSGNITHAPIGNFDMYLVKLSSTGTIEWDSRFGGTDNASASDALELPGGGYIIGGSTNSPQGFDVTDPSYGLSDYWLVRIDANGNKLWDKRYGGTLDESAIRILKHPNGGYLLVSASLSDAGGVKTQNNYVSGKSDIWCIAVDTSGNIISDKIIGSLEDDIGIDAWTTPDSNFIFSCINYANIGADKTENTYNVDDFWVIKTDPLLNRLWDHSVGGDSNEDEGGKLSINSDGSYLVTGTSYSGPGFWKSVTNNGPENTWCVRIDANGNKIWDKTLITGYSHTEAGYAVQLADGCFVICNDGDGFTGNDKTDVSYGFDYWCVKYCDSTFVQPDPCAFTVTAGNDSTSCVPLTLQLNGSTSLLNPGSVLWQPSTGLSDSTILSPSANVNATTTYILTVSSSAVTDLIFNGNFDQGDTGFTSIYIPGQGGISGTVSNPGDYDINVNPDNSHIDFASFGDHNSGTGNMLIANGSVNAGDNLWCQDVIVLPNTNYTFSMWATMCNWQNPAIIHASANGVALGSDLYLAADTGVWHQLTAVWNSGTDTLVTLCISDLSNWSAGNDFAIDDITFTGLGNACSHTDSVTVSISSSVSVSLGNDISFCEGDSTVIMAPSGFASYQWIHNLDTINAAADSIMINQGGNYIATVSDANGCTASDTVTVFVNALPLVQTIADTSVCGADTIRLTASGASTYIWFPATYLDNDTVASPFTIPLSSVTYILTGVDTNDCINTDTVNITFGTLPDADFAYTLDYSCAGIELTTDNNSLNANNYLWTFGDGSSSTDSDPFHVYSSLNSLPLMLVAMDGACADTVIRQLSFQIPAFADSLSNVFTPNNDGINDCFETSVNSKLADCTAMKIYNRWGQLVFDSSATEKCWKGQHDGTESPEGVYFYVMTVLDKEYHGTVHLYR